MPVTRDQPAPYAPPSAIMSIVERHRNKGLPSPVDAEVLERAGISPSLVNRTLQALQGLDLVDEEGRPTDVLEGIRLAPEAEYRQRLTEWLNGAYADALTFVDPSKDDEVAIRDAFRSYKPVGQQDRMVTLFIGLFTAAGVMPERPKQAPARKVAASSPRVRGSVNPPPRTRARSTPAQDGGGGRVAATSPHAQFAGLPPALAGLLRSLPSEETGWSRAQRDKFHNAFGVMLDFCFPIVSEASAKTETADE